MSRSELPPGAGWLLSPTPPDSVFIPEDCSAEQFAIARAAEVFVQGEVVPRIAELERHDWELTRRLLRQAGELGLLGAEVPEAYGGIALDPVSVCLVSEQFGRQASFSISHGAHAGIGTLPLVFFGTEAQKRKYLPRLVTGEIIGAYALSEAGSGSDALAAATRARLNDAGTHYILNGAKMWTSNAGFADLITVFCHVEAAGEASTPGTRTFSAFLVERSFPGVSIGREEHKLGLHGSSTCRVILEDAQVPVENLLHEVGRGHLVALNVLNSGRLRIATGLLGGLRDLIAISARYANERHQMGHPISHYGMVRAELAEQAARLYATESAVYRTCAAIGDWETRCNDSAGTGEASAAVRALEEHLIECALAKILASETADYLVDEALQIHGGYGYTEEFPLARAYRDTRINRIFEGTNEINRLNVAGHLLRRAQRGRLPLLEAARQAEAALLRAPGGNAADSATSGASTLEIARQTALAVIGIAARRFGEHLPEDQQIMGAIADMAIDLYAAESGELRAARLQMRDSGSERARVAAVMAAFYTESAAERIQWNARRILLHGVAGEELQSSLALLQPLAARIPVDTFTLRESVAAAVLRDERYPVCVV